MPAEGLGSKSSEKLHKEVFDAIRFLEAEYMEGRSMLLPNGDPRRIAYAEAIHCPFSNSFLGAMPNPACQFSSEEFRSAVQNKFGVPQSECIRLTGLPISNNNNCRQEYVDKFGYKLKTATGVRGDGVRHLHDKVVNIVSVWLRRSRIPHSGGRYGTPRTCQHIFTNDLMLSDKSSDEATKLRQGIIPDLHIKRLADGSNDETIIDVKTLGPGESYKVKFPHKATEAKQTRVIQDYLRTARKLDASTTQATSNSMGPAEKHLRSCTSGGVLPFVVGAFGGASPMLTGFAYELAKVQAADYSHAWKVDNKTALGLIKHNMHQELGLCLHRGWARLMLDRLKESVHLSPSHPSADTEETYDSWESREHNYRYPDTYVSAHRVKN